MEKNMMREYLESVGCSFSDNPVVTFCRYWGETPAAPRQTNDLDCIYMKGDPMADTLQSAWTPLKWVLQALNPCCGLRISKQKSFLKTLEEDVDRFLPPGNILTGLLYSFLEIAMLRCNYILLPDRGMNPARYMLEGGVLLYDLVPCTLYYIFEDSLGKYFGKELSPEEWVRREKLECGFLGGVIDQVHVKPLTSSLKPWESRQLTDPEELSEALRYMITLLEQRQLAML